MSKEQLTEIARVLNYPKIARILRWKRNQIERLFKQIYLRTVMVEVEASVVIKPLRHADDSSILRSLLAAQAEYLVTGDSYPIITPAEFAARL